MPVSRNLIILITFAFITGACSGLKGFEKTDPEKFTNNPFPPLKGEYGQALYKTQMDAFGKHFSGILLFKPEPLNSSFRVVLLSEFGLNLMDLSMKSNGTTVNSCQDFLNRPVIINSIEKNIRMLVYIPENKRKIKKYRNHETNEFAVKSGCFYKNIYFCNQDGRLTKIEQRRFFLNRLTVKMEGIDVLPSVINFENRPVKHRMKLSFLKIDK
ncbi:MAG: hypothetical protein V1775_17380 [Bacteroidota bacterium]